VKQFIDFIPLLLFFIVYKIDPRVIDIAGHELTVGGIYSATAVLIISSVVVYGAIFISQRKLEKKPMADPDRLPRLRQPDPGLPQRNLP